MWLAPDFYITFLCKKKSTHMFFLFDHWSNSSTKNKSQKITKVLVIYVNFDKDQNFD